MKLKTLEDINIHEEMTPYGLIEELRQEAIKWIKELEQNVKKIQTNNFKLPYKPTDEEWVRCEQLLSKRDWIKVFFNLKEDDLK